MQTEEFSSPLLLSSTKPRSFSFLWPVLLRSVDVELPKHFWGNPGSQCAVTPLRASRSPAATCDSSRFQTSTLATTYQGEIRSGASRAAGMFLAPHPPQLGELRGAALETPGDAVHFPGRSLQTH